MQADITCSQGDQLNPNRQRIESALLVYERTLDVVSDLVDDRNKGICSREKLLGAIRMASAKREFLQQVRSECAQW